SGKTEAAVIPIFTILSTEERKGIRMLYITPLRALNRDIFRRIINYAESVGLSVEVRHSDTPRSVRERMVIKPPNVLITTPETLAILLVSKKMSLNLKNLEWVVIDELHELIGNERGAHLSISLERLASLIGRDFVRIGLSATIGDLNEAKRFLVGVGRECAIIIDKTVREYDIDCKLIENSFVNAANHILDYVNEIGGKGKNILVFTNTRDEAEYLGAMLKTQFSDVLIEVHHGSLSREIREDTEVKLRMGEAGIVISTSSLELGIDIGSIFLVIQWGSPRQAIKLIQRVGRSRHKIGEKAVGLIITDRLDDELESWVLIDRVRKMLLERIVMHENSLDVLIHHLAGLSLERGTFNLEDALSIIKRAYPFRNIDIKDVDASLQLLNKQGIIRYDGKIVKRRVKTYQYYYDNISTIPDIQQFDVFDISSKRIIGKLDGMFIGEYLEPDKLFVLKGSSWRTISINDNKMVVNVEPIFQEVAIIPHWMGEMIPVDFNTAIEVGKLRKRIINGKEYRVSERVKEFLMNTREHLGIIPDDQNIVIEKKKDGNIVVIHACFGSKVNQTLATLLSVLLSSKSSYIVEAKSDPYRIALSSYGTLSEYHIEEVLKGTFDLNELISAGVWGTHPFNWRVWHIAKRFGVINKEAQYDRKVLKSIQDKYKDTPLCREALRELLLDKYDLAKTQEILSAIKEGKIKIILKEVNEFSPLAKPILEQIASFINIPTDTEKEKMILDLVKKRLYASKHKLVCLSCGKWQSVVKVEDVKDNITCPLCHSHLITATYVSDDEIIKILKKRNKSLDDEKKLRKYWKVSSLIQNFGKRALLTLAGFGIGADTAARILRNYISDEELLKSIYRAEKLYVATRGFWNE
ncbi:MAG: DEAD/DEAH box helicase, partial [Nitrososphaerales archaeon]